MNNQLIVHLTAPTLPEMIEEASSEVVSWLRQLPKAPRNHVREIKLKKMAGRVLTYESYFRQMDGPEYKQEYYEGKNGK